MKWFGKKAGRVAARPFLLRGWQAAAGEPWPRSYEAQVREAYLGNPVAQRAVRLVAEGVASASVYDLAAEKDRPSTGSGRTVSLVPAALLEAAAAQLLLHGNAYLQILTDAEGEPAELFPLRPERVTIEADAAGWPAAYVYKAGEARTRLPARDGLGRPSLVHLRTMHPLDDHYGSAASARRRARWRSTTKRRAGTRRCSTMRRGRAAP
jgi:phage portal protein BeeE